MRVGRGEPGAGRSGPGREEEGRLRETRRMPGLRLGETVRWQSAERELRFKDSGRTRPAEETAAWTRNVRVTQWHGGDFTVRPAARIR